MDKRIKFVWLLSLITAFTVIVIQGYWVWNQFQYAIGSSSEELVSQILEICEEEAKQRQKENITSTIIQFDRNYIFDPNNPSQSSMNLSLSNLPDDLLANKTLYFYSNMPEDALQDNLRKYIANILSPLHPDTLYSHILQSLPIISPEIVLIEGTEFDKLEKVKKDKEIKNMWETSWILQGSLLKPFIEIYYPYAIIERKAMFIKTFIPLPHIFQKMLLQLITVFIMMLILSACLIYQIKTILKQKQLSDYQKGFVNTMIHELKRPVQTLKVFVSFLKDKEMRKDEETSEQIIEDSMFELDNLSAYLGKLKDMVRADTDMSTIRPESLDIEDTIRKVVRLISIPENKKVNFEIHTEGEKTARVDPVHFANMISNLIENAIKYSGETVNIAIQTNISGNNCCLSVTDNGIGILPSEREKVFSKFHRGGNHPDQEIPGLGLGLSYVKLITEAHQGEVLIDSKQEEGTTITINIPQ